MGTMNDYFSQLFEGGLRQGLEKKALEEKEKQAQTATQPTSGSNGETFDSLKQDAGDGADDGEASKTSTDSQALEGTPTFDDIVEKLNAIRAGKSLRDEEISANFKNYIGNLKPAEQTALFVFLKAIAQILSGEVPQQSVIRPDADPTKLSIKKTQAQTRHVKPNIIKRPISALAGGGGNKGPKTSKEDTAAPTPVQPKKRV